MINKDLISSIIEEKSSVNITEEKVPNTVLSHCHSNVVSEEKLKKVQVETLNMLRDNLSKTYGPMGSYTSIITGSGPQDILTTYSKDGLKVLKHIYYDSPIELAIQSELVDICKYVEQKVGDGTTSAVILSSLIYNGLLDIISSMKIPPRKIVNEFTEIVSILKKLILNNGRDITYDDIYDICMISTNGNTTVSKNIKKIYEEYGFDINIDVSISNDQNTKIKEYDGLTVNAGYSDPAYINNPAKGTCDIRDAKIYSFQDPVDTPEMISFFEKILMDNIFTPASNNQDMIPTVIICPMISRDGNGLLNKLIEILHQFDQTEAYTQKPPVLILTNIHGTDDHIANDIARLCNCKGIRKYINAEVQKHEQETGEAPTLETVHNFAGTAELVSADVEKCMFINTYDSLYNDNKTYNGLINFLKSEIKNSEDNNEDVVSIGRLKKRLRALESNIVEYLVGGITVSDRDSLKDLVEDAVKNCASASEYGVGRAANFEGLVSSYNMLNQMDKNNDIGYRIISVIFKAYYTAAGILYSTVVSENDIDDVIIKSLENDAPFNVVDLLYNGEFTTKGTNVLCSIMTDIEILDAISKIISMMVTSNQCLLQTTTLNRY